MQMTETRTPIQLYMSSNYVCACVCFCVCNDRWRTTENYKRHFFSKVTWNYLKTQPHLQHCYFYQIKHCIIVDVNDTSLLDHSWINIFLIDPWNIAEQVPWMIRNKRQWEFYISRLLHDRIWTVSMVDWCIVNIPMLINNQWSSTNEPVMTNGLTSPMIDVQIWML